MLKRRDAAGFNLAFLDVMACGLGAVILIFMLVKFNAATSTPSDEETRLQAEIAQQQALAEQLARLLDNNNQQLIDTQRAADSKQMQIDALSEQARQTQQAAADKSAVLANLEKAVAAAAPKQADDPLALKGKGEERYLLGLKVEGRQIGILLDNSASMADEKLIDILRYKVSSNAERQTAPKWQRSKRAAKWLLARLPAEAKVTLFAFNQQPTQLGPSAQIAANDAKALGQLAQQIDQLVPEQGTNLQAALMAIKQANPAMDHLYIITDGLPTLGVQDAQLKKLRQCPSLYSGGSTIDGNCRLILFGHSVRQAAFQNVSVNVVLMPLEGDPDAAQAYWNWTSNNGGMLLSPAEGWP